MFSSSFARLFPLLLCVALMAPSASAQTSSLPHAKNNKQSSITVLENAPRHLLPSMFAGWQITDTPQNSTDPQIADAGNAAVLKEYGFARYEAATYTRDSDSLTIKAIEFGDATGAYGAFTFYRRPNMAPEDIGQGAAFDGARVLFWNGTVLVDARLGRVTPMSASELRDLITELPQPVGNQGIVPRLPDYLPSQRLEANTIQYTIGPQAYRLSGGVLPPELVNFDMSAEAVTAQYNSLNGTGTLTIINYPTPEIAKDRQRAIQAYFAHKSGNTLPWTPAIAYSNPPALQSRVSGPLVAFTSGSFSPETAQQLLQRVHYEVNLTLGSSSKYVPDTTKLAQIILSVAILVGIFAVIAIVAGFSLGGGRILWRRMHNKPGEEPEEFIRLNLKD